MKEVGVGIIGLGWGQLQVEAFGHVNNARVVAVCDCDAGRSESVAKAFNIARKYTDVAALIHDPDVQLVSVAVPPESQKLIVCAAMEAGKQVLCEKPVGLIAKEAQELLGSAESRKIVHAVDFEMRYLPALAYAKELVDEDYLGQLFRVDVTMGMERPWGEHGNWAADDARGGGILREVGSHFIDTLVWMFGDVKEVFAERRTHFPTIRFPDPNDRKQENFVSRQVTGDDAFWCAMKFERGGEALLNFVTGARHDPGWSISAYGRQGTLVIKSGYLSGARVGDREMEVLGIPKRLELPDKPRDPLMWSMVRLFERVVAKIRGEKDALAHPTFRDACTVAQIVDRIRRASEEQVWLSVS
jgi:predicted dehydrogenase